MNTEKTNILLLHTDQQRFDTIAAHGNPYIQTPNIDRLVNQGTSFMRAYSSFPLCMPARHDLITGVSGRHHGYWGNTHDCIKDYGLNTVPRLLSIDGYQTFAVGKMHFCPSREHHGFNHMFLMEEIPGSIEDDAYLQYLEEQGYSDVKCEHGVRPLFYHTPQASRVPEEHHGSAWIAHKTIDLLKTKRKEPFFIFSSWVGPHPPYYVPQKYLDMYRDKPLPDPIHAESTSRQRPSSPENAQPERLKRIREAYYAATTFIDHQIGRILDTLEETEQLKNTLIIFMTDHGESLGDNGTYQKVQPYDYSARIPMIVCGPGYQANKQTNTPVTTWDVSTTILKTAGIKPPAKPQLIGSPMNEVQTNETNRICNYNAMSGQDRYIAAVSHRYKYIHYYNGGDDELYDLIEDPQETINIVETTDQSLVAELKKSCISFEKEHGQEERIKDGQFVDFEYKPWDPYSNSLYPYWSSFQFPKWMPEYTDKILNQIATEMEDCFKDPSAFIHTDENWRQDAIDRWQAIGGDQAVYKRLFDIFDTKLKNGEVTE